MSKVTADVSHPSWHRQTQIGRKISVGYSGQFFKDMYSKYCPYPPLDQEEEAEAAHGGIRNIEFSPDGSFILAACDKHSLLMVDPLTQKTIRCVDAHTSYVTNVKFLDPIHIATGSFDSTIALWDARNLKTHFRLLTTRSHPVQDLEFSPKDDLLLTSGFDDSIRTWDLTSDEVDPSHEIFLADELMSMRYSADASRMVLSMARGYLVVVHGVELGAFVRDLGAFQPDECLGRLRLHLLQAGVEDGVGPPPTSYALFSRRARNRVEIVTQFPRENDSVVLSSLALHPAGETALTWGSSLPLELEWTIVHDVSGHGLPDPRHDDEADSDDEADLALEAHCIAAPLASPPVEEEAEDAEDGHSQTESGGSMEVALSDASYLNDPFPDHAPRHQDPESGDVSELELEAECAGSFPYRPLLEEDGDTKTEGSSSMELEEDGDTKTESIGSMELAQSDESSRGSRAPLPEVAGDGASAGVDERVRVQRSVPAHAPSGQGPSSSAHFAAPPRRPRRSRIFQYFPRLTHFLEESGVGDWQMKESDFSPDGRLMAVPLGCSVGLLALSPECHEITTCVPRTEPLALHKLATNVCRSVVHCTKFSPRHYLIASGCSSGRIVWHQPLI